MKTLGLKIQTVETCSSASSTHRCLFLQNTKISIFGGISKFCLKVDFCRFLQFWANFAALAMVDSMPKDHIKSKKSHNF
jgi:hypothetical protein